MENRYNLIEEKWIPVVEAGLVSLKDIFSNNSLKELGGNPREKIALLKLLLAISQAAWTPKDNDEWRKTGADGLARRCLAYLEKWHDKFYLYGKEPFLQMPAVRRAKVNSFGDVMPELPSNNGTILTQVQVERPLDDAAKARLIVTLMSMALGGKQDDRTIVLSPGYQKPRRKASKPGPGILSIGCLHSFLFGNNIVETCWLNLFTEDQIREIKTLPCGLGTPPWEKMPAGEDCEVARRLKDSLFGRLVSLCRFCLLNEQGLHCTEGIIYPPHTEGIVDPSVAIDSSKKNPKIIWADPEKRPWRELTSLLSFISNESSRGFECRQLINTVDRARDVVSSFAVWSGGLRVSNNAGEQYVSGSDDYVESVTWFKSDMIGEIWFSQFTKEMEGLKKLASNLSYAVFRYYRELQSKSNGNITKDKKLKNIKGRAESLFWELSEKYFQGLVNSCS
ncbi:MAG: type I-E CRISPR-associated protein Cse1/CasA, partial [Candidatus Dadabacteria bacterium]